ncbi:hypothetical protein BGZ47_011334 [Haplosporangium gracile]|nr:hypothetical protein BGZ47_011334 [Haplosporangium gracile]
MAVGAIILANRLIDIEQNSFENVKAALVDHKVECFTAIKELYSQTYLNGLGEGDEEQCIQSDLQIDATRTDRQGLRLQTPNQLFGPRRLRGGTVEAIPQKPIKREQEKVVTISL